MRAVLLILILAAIVGLRIAQGQGRKGLGVPVAVLALVALGLSLTFILRSPEPSYVDRLEPLHRSVGYTLGHAVRAHSPEVSTVLVLQDRRPDPTRVRLSTQQLEGLRTGLGEPACELVELNLHDLQGERKIPAEEGVDREALQSSYDQFKAVVEANPQAETIVSFVGYPSYVRLLLRRDPEYHAFVWDLGNEENVDWDAELAAGRVAARVGNKRNPDMQADLTSSMSMEEIFGTRYELVTAP